MTEHTSNKRGARQQLKDSQVVRIVLTSALIAQLDAVVEADQKSRSRIVREAVRDFLARSDGGDDTNDPPVVVHKKFLEALLSRIAQLEADVVELKDRKHA